jgi:hypothetical protein
MCNYALRYVAVKYLKIHDYFSRHSDRFNIDILNISVFLVSKI